MEKPLISVIVLVYNNDKYLCELLDSIFEQDYENIELIVSDDHSDSFDAEKYRQYIKSGARENIVSGFININEQNLGTVAHYEKMRKQCHGEYITIISADDAYYDGNVLTNLEKEFHGGGMKIDRLSLEKQLCAVWS